MKVLMFGWEFPPHISGGLGTACFGLTKSMTKLGVEIDFVLPKVSQKSDDEFESPVELLDANSILVESEIYAEEEYKKLIKFYQVNSTLQAYQDETSYQEYLSELKEKNQLLSKLPSITYGFAGGYGKNLISEVYRLAYIAKQLGSSSNYNVIHAHDWMTYPAGVAAKESSGKPLVIHVHATEVDRSGENLNNTVYEIEKMGMEKADLILAVSNKTKDTLVARYGVSPHKIRVVHNGVAQDKPVSPPQKGGLQEKIVLFLGRITHQKGPGFFVEAAEKVLAKTKNVRFVMAGSGDLLKDTVFRIASKRMQERFHFTGFLSGDDLDKMFAMSDICVMPSISEPFGIVPFEAIRYGIPVIVSKQSGVAEVMDHAIKVDYWDTSALSKEILTLLKDGKKRKKLVSGNYKTLMSATWDKPAQKVLNAYKELV